MDYPRTPEHNILRALPFFLLFLLLALMGWAGYRGYKSAHPRPKAEQWAYQGRPCKGTDCREEGFLPGKVAADQPFGMQCNSGVFVTDLTDCAEYHGAGWDRLHFAFTHQPRKHKRKLEPGGMFADTIGYVTAGPGLVFSSGVTSYERSYMQIVGDKELDFRQWDKAGSHYTIDASPDAFDCPAEFEDSADHMHSQLVIRCTPKREDFPDTTIIDRRKPIAEKKPDCPRAPDGDGDFYVDSDGCLRLSFTPMPLTCGADEECRWSVAHVTPDKPATTPQDITNLMEQIAPTKDQYICREAGECFPKCDSPLTPSITRACYQITFSGQRVLILPSNYAPGFTCPNEFESCGVVNSAIMISHELPRGCKMPADVDVCPTQQLDPKKSHD